jgi:hypothetical protein
MGTSRTPSIHATNGALSIMKKLIIGTLILLPGKSLALAYAVHYVIDKLF